jgi:hypothetical protein
VDLEADPDWEWHSAGEDTPEQLEALWQGAVLRSGSIGPPTREAHNTGGLESAPRLGWMETIAGVTDTTGQRHT